MPRTPRKTPRSTHPKADAAQLITDEIVALLEKGTLPWRRPWRTAGGGVPLRHGGEGYRGINAFLLGMRAALMGYTSPYWMTFQQARAMDACVRKGERSSVVVYYGTAKAKDAEDGAGGDRSGSDGAEGDGGNSGAYRFLKSYRVFNATQIDGLDARFHPEPEGDPADGPEPIPACQAFFDAIGADVSVGGDRACYVPSADRIYMPPMARFESAEKFFATLGHEHVHYTKAPDRLDRSFGASIFGNEAYAREELCAEIGAAVLGQRLGFTAHHLDDHAAYIAEWIKVLRGDKRFLFTAAAHAQRAVDWLVEAAAKGGIALDDDGPAPIPTQAVEQADEVAA
ncbi:ArdC family protein [Jannaschia rubra]|uniref:DNA primase TraC n=1 Tax=Jannaschia rubra TaxID=282197 RepID=A0A0M6XUJ5_9RHOB|nr:zincin-like metallopeptidase domain-containing protein [Jannaschia rubra]CTQ34819.1 DNA primase TraC [Jannaschia rubra]SFG67753.1 Antirestriction protein ArdC [Jannaschia rubra]